jgi:hypothetical protein
MIFRIRRTRSGRQRHEAPRSRCITIAASLCLMIFSLQSGCGDQHQDSDSHPVPASGDDAAGHRRQERLLEGTYATVEVWSRRNAASRWVQWAPTAGRVGRRDQDHSRAERRFDPGRNVQNSLGFGLYTNPNTKGMRWQQLVNDSWVGDPHHRPTYNTFQTWFSSGWDRAESERLWNCRYGQSICVGHRLQPTAFLVRRPPPSLSPYSPVPAVAAVSSSTSLAQGQPKDASASLAPSSPRGAPGSVPAPTRSSCRRGWLAEGIAGSPTAQRPDCPPENPARCRVPEDPGTVATRVRPPVKKAWKRLCFAWRP